MKKTITKILSILCLLGVLACAFVPCMKLTGDYQATLGMITQISSAIPEEALPMIEELLKTQNIELDIKGILDSFTNLLEPLNDGEIAIVDFVTVSQNCTEVANKLSGLPVEGIKNPMEGIEIPGDNPMMQMYESVNSMIMTLAQIGAVLPLLSYVLLVPVALFGVLAFFVVLRIILRILGRRGLGIGITFLAILNAVFMIGLPVVVSMYAASGLPFGLAVTNVPYIMVGCCVVNCIIWAIGRGAKVKKVKEEAVVEAPVVEEAPVEEVATEEVVAEEAAVEETEVEETEEVVEEEVVEE